MSLATLAPFARLRCAGATSVTAVGDDTCVFTGPGRATLLFAGGDGVVVDELQFPVPGCLPYFVCVDGAGVVYGCVHGSSGGPGEPKRPAGVMIARRGAGAVKLVPCEVTGTPHLEPVTGVGVIVQGEREAFLIREDESVEPLRLPLRGGRSLHARGVRWWNHDLLVCTCVVTDRKWGETAEHEFHVVAGDGTVRCVGPGDYPIAIDDDHALVWDFHTAHVIDHDGKRIDTVALGQPAAIHGPSAELIRYGGDVIVQSYYKPAALARISPRAASTPIWVAELPREAWHQSNGTAALVGRHVAIGLRGFPEPRTFVVDADTGAARHLLADSFGGPVVVAGSDAIAGIRTSREIIAWTGLASEHPARVLLTFEGHCNSIGSPSAGVVAGCIDAADPTVDFYRLGEP